MDENNDIKISLILCTLERTQDVKNFLLHANDFTFTGFEIIIADQNPDDRILKILNDLNNRSYSVVHIKTPIGLSRSRNIAVKYAKGDIIAFPDDDCLYEPDTLEKVYSFFTIHKSYDVLIAKWCNTDSSGIDPHVGKVSHKIISVKEVFSFMSSEIFVRKRVFNIVGYFDEKLGLGSGTILKGGEDYDFLIRCFNKSLQSFYSSEIIIKHPWKGISTATDKNRIQKYLNDIVYAGASDFYVMVKNFSLLKSSGVVLNNVIMMLYLFLKSDILGFKTHLYRIKGFVKGFIFIIKNGIQ
jgi:glycosyltransferase involved in cell wall biosynthesis